MIQFTIAIPKDKNDKNFERSLINTHINACRMLSGVVGDFLSKMIMANFQQHADFDMKCPIAKVAKQVLI